MSKKIYLINAKEPYFKGKFASAAGKLDVEYKYIDLTECIFYANDQKTYLYHNHELIEPKEGYFLIRRIGEDSFFSYLLTEFLHQHDAAFMDPGNRSHTQSDGKIAQLLRLTTQGIPFPESFLCRPYSFEMHRDFIIDKIKLPCVVKRTGARGEAVWFVKTEEELIQKMQEAPFEVHILQRYIPNEHDMRVIVFEDKVVGAMKRTSADGFANTSYDAKLEISDITKEEKTLAIDVCKKMGVDFGGVDLVRSEEGLMIWEVNKVPQLDRFIPATGIEALEVIVKTIKDRYLED